nr:splicing regulator RBM11 isoform X2 [Anolis sagrei ordinatus]
MAAASGRAEEPDRTLFVGNLESRVHEEILYELFLQAGPITNVTVCKDKDGKPKAFGFVCFKHTESVPYAIGLLNGIRLYGRPIKLQYRFGSSHPLDLNSSCENMDSDVQSTIYRQHTSWHSNMLLSAQLDSTSLATRWQRRHHLWVFLYHPTLVQDKTLLYLSTQNQRTTHSIWRRQAHIKENEFRNLVTVTAV